tara:strand:+ start:1952 stop:2134 length:183 start_codon:yes stop_codon:yes gene_type:complete
MAYYVKKQGLSGKVVYWTGENVWSDDPEKKTLLDKEIAENMIKNPDGKNGGFTGSEVVFE